MKVHKRFIRAKEIALPRLEHGDYMWTPQTTIGWIVRIACTDVGQVAWQQARVDTSDFYVASTLVEAVDLPDEKDLKPE